MAVHRVILPKVGLYDEDIVLSQWHREEGAQVRTGEVVLTFETDKVSSDVEAEADGWLHRTAEADSKLPVGSEVGAIATTREEYEALAGGGPTEAFAGHPFLSYVEKGGPAATAAAAPLAPVAPRASRPKSPGRDKRQLVSPRARALIATLGLRPEEVTRIRGTGPQGRVVDRDVEAYLASREEAAPGEVPIAERIPLRARRRVIAERMLQSLLESAQLTSILELDVSPLSSWQASRQPRVGYTAIFVRLLGLALRQHPLLNARVAGDEIEVLAEVNVGVAVDAEEGLIVPVLRRADELSLDEIEARLADLVSRARDKQLGVDDLAGGTFTLSNGGIYPVDITTAIINPPQTGILWLGRIRERPVAIDGAVAVRPTVQACLTFDHRVVDGGPAARFLGTLEELVRRFPASVE